jgi:hypothetical protein
MLVIGSSSRRSMRHGVAQESSKYILITGKVSRSTTNKQTNFVALSPQANYTD